MRTLGTSFHYTQQSHMTTAEATNTAKATFSPPATIQRSVWHSPVLYLFGGLATVFGLIALALLMLAYSYWKTPHQENNGGDTDIESGETQKGDGNTLTKAAPMFEETFLVIMAGELNPTFLATPVSAKPSKSFYDDEKEESKTTLNDQTAQSNGEQSEEQSRVNQEQSPE